MDTEEIQRVIRFYFKSLYTIKLENLNEMDGFLDRYQLPKLSRNQVNHPNSHVTPKEVEPVMKNLTTKK